MDKEKSNRQVIWYLLGIVVLVSPQMMTQHVLLGSDSLFHYNRFYDIAMQLRENNLQSVISIYGFQETGRMINAMYGPLSAYFLGGLLVLSGTWFRFQIVSQLVLFGLAFFSMAILLKRYGVNQSDRYVISLFFVTTFAIQYWTARQGFSSWGAALMPVCLLPTYELIKNHRLSGVAVGLSVAVLVQTHLFSSLLIVVIYFVIFILVWWSSKRKERFQLIWQLVISLTIFAIATSNVWLLLIHSYRGNHLLSPFINSKMYLNTTTANSTYWLFTPMTFILVIVWQLRQAYRQRRLLSKGTYIIGSLAFLFLSLSTNLVPWRYLTKKSLGFIELIQFPFRFFIPFTVSFCLFVGMTLTETKRRLPKSSQLIVILALIQTIITSAWGLSDNRQQLLNSATLGKHVRLTATSSDSLIQSLHSRNLSDLFNQLNKSTPDYLPIYAETTKNKYQQYREEVIECVGFDKKVVSGKLRVSWKSNFWEQVSVPVIVYAGTRVNLNGKELDKSRVILSDIGVPTVQSSQGENWLELDYPKTHFFNYLLLGVIGWWIGCLWYLMRKQRDAKRMRVPRPSLVSSVILKGQIDEIDE